MSAYVIFNYKIMDRSQIDELTKRALPIDEQYGAEVIIGSPVKAVEGQALPNMVVYKFDSFAQAERWYYSDEQQALTVFRQGMTQGWVAIVPGVDETDDLVASGYFDCESAPSK